MSNESYLICSYFAAAGIGLFLAALTASELARPLREAVAGLTEPLARILRRVLPVWLILAVLLGFMSVTYFDCAHDSYAKIVADRAHVASKTRQQGRHMAHYLAVGLAVYALVLTGVLAIKARRLGD